jgi:hypothetical protein
VRAFGRSRSRGKCCTCPSDQLPRRMRRQRRGYALGVIFATAEADFTMTESTRKQVPRGPGERPRQNHMGHGLPPICIRPTIGFIANAPLTTRAGVVSSVVVRAYHLKTHDEREATDKQTPAMRQYGVFTWCVEVIMPVFECTEGKLSGVLGRVLLYLPS